MSTSLIVALWLIAISLITFLVTFKVIKVRELREFQSDPRPYPEFCQCGEDAVVWVWDKDNGFNRGYCLGHLVELS